MWRNVFLKKNLWILGFWGPLLFITRFTFEFAWAHPYAWVFHSKNHPVFILLYWSFLYIKWGVLIWFLLNPRNFNPRNFQFFIFFHSKPLFLCRTLWRHWYQNMWNSIAHLLMYVGILLWDAHLRRHPRKSFKI